MHIGIQFKMAIFLSFQLLAMKNEDEDDTFGLLVGKLMKKVPEENRDDLRMNILKLLKDAKGN